MEQPLARGVLEFGRSSNRISPTGTTQIADSGGGIQDYHAV